MVGKSAATLTHHARRGNVGAAPLAFVIMVILIHNMRRNPGLRRFGAFFYGSAPSQVRHN
jgi:hypothetical protein